MNTFLRTSFNEYLRQSDLKKSFLRQNKQVHSLFVQTNLLERLDHPIKLGQTEDVCLLLLSPLVEVAWADGRVTSRESDAILQAADGYGLTGFEDLYCSLMETMISRPSPKARARDRFRLHQLLVAVPANEFETIAGSLLVQARYVAEQSSNNLIGFLRGDGICRDEESVLQQIAEELKKVEIERGARACVAPPRPPRFEEMEKLLPLVPLVKVAWSEGRVTAREREIVLAAARRSGIEPGSTMHERLLEWLDFHPSDDFYNSSLENLRRSWQSLADDERILRRLDLLSDCALVAEASSGNRRDETDGARICEEEMAALKRIAQRLNDNQSMALS